MEVYNVQPARVDIRVTRGDTLNVSFSIAMNAAPYVLTGKQIDIMVKRFDGTVVKTLSSVDPGAAIVIDVDSYEIYTEGFTDCDTLKYDVQVTDGVDVLTIQKGKIIVEEEITD